MMTRALRQIDENRPRAEVCGLPGVCFEQDGILFTSAGVEAVAEDYAQPPEEEIPDDNPYDPNIGRVVIESGEISSHEEPDGITPGEVKPLESMHHMQLKGLLKIYGLEWHNREQAIEELRAFKKTA